MKERSVFLNVPFDAAYERLFVALIASLVSIGRIPRSVLEIPETGVGRLERIQQMLEQCRVSIHDLSRVGTPVRFNMPFELGLACNLARLAGPHDYILFEKNRYRLDRTLSDLKGRDPYIHGNSAQRIALNVLDALGPSGGGPKPARVLKVAADLWRIAIALKSSSSSGTVFKRTVFMDLVENAVYLALEGGLIDP